MTQEQNTKSNQLMSDDDITFKFLPTLKTFEENGKKYCRLTASSNGEDLVGDIMSEKALKQMKTAAVGMLMFMNHSTNVPEDVFGAVVESELKRDSVELVGGGTGELAVLDFVVEVEDANERAVKCWQMIDGGKKLGASVTVLVKDKSPNPKRNRGIVIEDVEYLETSIVGIPCNRQSWAYAASKALNLAEKRLAKNHVADEPDFVRAAKQTFNEKAEEEKSKDMSTENKNTAVVVGSGNETTGMAFARTIAAIEVYKTVSAQVEAKAENIQIPDVVAIKGMFNDILAQEPKIWELFDILCEVKWNLMSQKRNQEYLGQTDFTAIISAWDEALDEFKAAAIVSFKYWGDFDTAAEIVSYSLELEKSFQTLAEVYEKSSDENVRALVRESGAKMLEVAKKLNLIEADDAPDSESGKAIQIPAEASPEQIEKSASYIEMKKRAEAAEEKSAQLESSLEESQDDLETAKAGLNAANGFIESYLRSPMPPATAAEGMPATS